MHLTTYPSLLSLALIEKGINQEVSPAEDFGESG
jgi:hypothetical protein